MDFKVVTPVLVWVNGRPSSIFLLQYILKFVFLRLVHDKCQGNEVFW